MWVFFIGQSTLADLYVERERKTLMRLMATPVTVLQIVLSKYVYCFALSILVEFVLITLTTFVFGIDWGNPCWLLIIIVLINFAMTGVLALIYGISKNKAAADGLSVIVILFLGFLSGSFFPFEEMPAFFQRIGEWTVNRWAILGLRAVMDAKPLMDVWMIGGKLFLAGIITLSGGVFFLRRRLIGGEGI